MRVGPTVAAVARGCFVAGLVAVLAVAAVACAGDGVAPAGDGAAPAAPADDGVPKIVLGPDGDGFVADGDISPEASDGTDLSGLTFDLFDGGTSSIAGYEGTPLVVNFFASWCPPCVREMPEFQEVSEALSGRVRFLGLSQDQTADDALELVESAGVTYDVGWDLDLEVYGATGSIAMPTTAFVSPSGTLVDTFAGALDAEALTRLIETNLGVAARP